MITLIEISNRIEDTSDHQFDKRKYEWRPITIDNYELPNFHIPECDAKGSRAKLHLRLSKVLAFVDSVKHRRAKTGCTIMPISLTSKTNSLIWHSGTSVSKAIAFMKDIGLISVENNYYRFNAYDKNDNICKTYRYYKENEDKLKEYCKTQGIEPYCVKNTVYSNLEMENRDQSIDKSQVRFSSRLRLVKPDDMTSKEFEKQLTLCLYENYPGLAFFTEKANEINENYYRDYPELQIKFMPRFTWSKKGNYVKGIGIRATNSLTNVKKSDRRAVLEAYGLNLEKDINASVPRMTLSLNSGRWIDESEDIYEHIFRIMEPDGEFTDEAREAIKKLHMRAYFESSDQLTGHHTWLAMNRIGIDKQDVCDKMADLRKALVQAEGGRLYGSEIFYVESCVYLMTLYDLLSCGCSVWQIYDGFYGYSSDEDVQEMFGNMISEGVKFNFEDFIRTWW